MHFRVRSVKAIYRVRPTAYIYTHTHKLETVGKKRLTFTLHTYSIKKCEYRVLFELVAQ